MTKLPQNTRPYYHLSWYDDDDGFEVPVILKRTAHIGATRSYSPVGAVIQGRIAWEAKTAIEYEKEHVIEDIKLAQERLETHRKRLALLNTAESIILDNIVEPDKPLTETFQRKAAIRNTIYPK